jgi:molecular chaperone GrpE (heat shock protein)
MLLNPREKVDFAKYPNETVAYLAGMVQNMNCQLVDELAEMKNYIINKLVMEIEEAKDPRVRVAALKTLGEVDGIDAFKRRSEITHVIKPIEEVEKELLTVLEGIEVKVISQTDAPINA